MIKFHPYVTACGHGIRPDMVDFNCSIRVIAITAMHQMAELEGIPLGPIQERWEENRWIMEVPPENLFTLEK